MKQIIDFITEVFDALGYFQVFHGLVVQVNEPGEDLKTYPAKADGSGDYEPVEFEDNMAYLRLNSFTDVPLDEEGCVNIVTRTYNTTLIVALNNDILDTPDEFISTRIAQNITNSLQDTTTKTLRTAIRADDVEIRVSNVELDPFVVWGDERTDTYTFPSDRLLISFTVTIAVEAHVSCLAILGCADAEIELVTTYIDSDGVEKTVALFTKVVCDTCADGNVQVNGVALVPGTVASGGTMLATLVDQNAIPLVPVMTATNVMTLTITGGPTVTVTVDDDTPTFNQSITITITSTGTPTSHQFWTPNQDGSHTITTQAGNTLAWTANVFGTFTIYGGADNGSISGYDIDGISVTNSQLVIDAVGSAANLACSLVYLRVAYVGDVIRVRRGSDNVEEDFNPTEITDGTLTTFTGAGDGFVVTFYDQSGNARDLTNAVAGGQPRIVLAGVLETDDNGLPTMVVIGGDQAAFTCTVALGLTIAAGISWFVLKSLGGDRSDFWFQAIKGVGSPYFGAGHDNSGGTVADSLTGTPDHYINGFRLKTFGVSAIAAGTLGAAERNQMRINVSTEIAWSADSDWNTFLMVIPRALQAGSFLSEIVFYNIDESANRDLIEQHRMNYYQLSCQE